MRPTNLLKILFALMALTWFAFDIELILPNPLKGEYLGVHMIPEFAIFAVLTYQFKKSKIQLAWLLPLFIASAVWIMTGINFRMPLRYFGNGISLLTTSCIAGLLFAVFEELEPCDRGDALAKRVVE